MSDAVSIHCPACGAGYLLPTHLLGEQGARVRCPGCQHGFVVSRDGVALHEPDASPAASLPAASDDPHSIATDLLVELESAAPGEVQQAAGEGRLFSKYGVVLLGAYDEFRRRAGSHSGSDAFREEVLNRYGVDLFGEKH